ncbi:MAG: type I pullulanase, partial [Muribaculaceae bacterium]|nr:type I pullulanase [Muribaculaceae bacterium]
VKYVNFPYAAQPSQVINYVSCHDDLCLTDKLAKSMPGSTEEERIAVAKLAQTIVFTSQGIPFMFTGEEVFRNKKGVHNSYCSPDSINAIDWNQKKQYRDLFDYYKGIINLRKLHPAFRMTTAEDVAKNLVFDEVAQPNLISYSIKNNANGDSWSEIKVILNGATKAIEVEVPAGEWTVVVKDGKVDEAGLEKSQGGKLSIAPRTALILAK